MQRYWSPSSVVHPLPINMRIGVLQLKVEIRWLGPLFKGLLKPLSVVAVNINHRKLEIESRCIRYGCLRSRDPKVAGGRCADPRLCPKSDMSQKRIHQLDRCCSSTRIFGWCTSPLSSTLLDSMEMSSRTVFHECRRTWNEPSSSKDRRVLIECWVLLISYRVLTEKPASEIWSSHLEGITECSKMFLRNICCLDMS